MAEVQGPVARIAGWDRLVATSTASTVGKALTEVRDVLVGQLNDAENRTEPLRTVTTARPGPEPPSATASGPGRSG